MKKLEVACFKAEDAKLALEMGADRIEFCHDYSCGGMTPSLDDFILLRSQFPDAKIHVMIRPREGDYVYSTYKSDVMKRQISEFDDAGADGFVIGILHEDHRINASDCQELIAVIKSNKPFIFHRAFDMTPNPQESAALLMKLGFAGILTSGAAKTAYEGLDNLKSWNDQYGANLQLIAGGGVRANNVKAIAATGVDWIHTAAWDNDIQALDPESLRAILENLKTA